MLETFHFKKLALVSALMTVSTVASAQVSYNLTNNPAIGAAPVFGSNANWSNGAPSGYVGMLPVNWYIHLQNSAGPVTETASSASAANQGALGIAVGARAYKDGSTNWGHNADFTLFKLDADATVTITVSSDNSALRSAFGLWSGWDTGYGNRHGVFLGNGAINPMENNPFSGISPSAGDAGISVVDANAWAVAPFQGTSSTTATATLTRFLTAGNYTLAIGGYDGTVAGQLAYTTTIAAVPIPMTAWLFGSAMAGLIGISRRKTT